MINSLEMKIKKKALGELGMFSLEREGGGEVVLFLTDERARTVLSPQS